MVKTLFALKLPELRDVCVELELVEGVEELERKKKPKVAAIVRTDGRPNMDLTTSTFWIKFLSYLLSLLGSRHDRRLNDFGLILYSLNTKMKCSTHKEIILPYVMHEIGPTMNELGIYILEDTLGYHETELALVDSYRISYLPQFKPH
ncbi:COX5A [Lepeophtheirus salmonis]|uniref:Cytochrome c oxidase subunit 5A, mitochondrial n=1 Tax=Lepeophtheirus salmonis TaxID=72036 RepID=A0A817FGH7_LEPSM|nr:COX5A [Lepeophtheirus salmonis]